MRVGNPSIILFERRGHELMNAICSKTEYLPSSYMQKLISERRSLEAFEICLGKLSIMWLPLDRWEKTEAGENKVWYMNSAKLRNVH